MTGPRVGEWERTLAGGKAFYITTPIYYVNGSPHIGSALTTVCCDVLARYRRMRGDRTWFLTGTDENATKVQEAAEAAGTPPRALVDRLAEEFKQAWTALGIGYDDFIRTTEPRHVHAVQQFFLKLRDSGHVYRGTYEGWYCISDETFFRESDVEDDHLCPNTECRRPLQRVQEENYFFRLSAFGEPLLQHIRANPEFLQPEFRRNEVVAFIEEGLRDMSITRANRGWGIPVPGEPEKVIYVWFDALINYLAATGWPEDPDFERFWPADVHLVGKEIYVRFHATLWPAMLMALGLPLPKTVYGHGWWVDAEGKKQGKRTGGLPHPIEFARELASLSQMNPDLASDALRYILLREMQFHGDTEYTRENLLKRYNTDLANDLGNLTNRSVNMLVKYFDGVVPGPAAVDPAIAQFGDEIVREYMSALEEFRFNAALEAVSRLVARMNKFIEENAPWRMAKLGETASLAAVLYTCLDVVRVVSALLQPVMPNAALALRRQIGLPAESAPSWEDAITWAALPVDTQVAPPQPLFPRIQDLNKTEVNPVNETTDNRPQTTSEPAPNTQNPTPSVDLITIDDFSKVQLRVADIEQAESVPNADKLLKLTVSLGDEKRTILAGIAEMYRPEELAGRQIVIVANLQPRKMRGIESQGMLLAADVDGQAIILQPETQVPPGSRVR